MIQNPLQSRRKARLRITRFGPPERMERERLWGLTEQIRICFSLCYATSKLRQLTRAFWPFPRSLDAVTNARGSARSSPQTIPHTIAIDLVRNFRGPLQACLLAGDLTITLTFIRALYNPTTMSNSPTSSFAASTHQPTPVHETSHPSDQVMAPSLTHPSQL